MSDDIAVLSLQIDSRDVKKGVDELDNLTAAGTRAEKTASSMQSTFIQMGKALAGAFSLYKAAEAIKDMTLLAARYNELGVVIRTIGQNAGYSAPYIASISHELEKTGISAIESRSAIAKLIQSNIDLTEANKLARIAQDAAVIGMTNSSDAYNRLIHGIQSGQVEVLRNIGLNVNFEASYQKLAREIGKTSAELSVAEKMQARITATTEAAVHITGAYEAAMSNAGKQLRSAERYAENLKVAIGQIFQPAFEAGVTSYTSALKAATENIDEIKNAIVGLTAAAATYLGLRIVEFIVGQVVVLSTFIASTQAARAASIAKAQAEVTAAAAAVAGATAHEAAAAAAMAEAAALNTAAASVGLYGAARVQIARGAAAAAATQAAAAVSVTAAVGAQAAAQAGLATAQASATATATLLSRATTMLGAGLALLGGPVGAVIIAITAAVGALYYFRDAEVELMGQTAQVRDFMQATWQTIRDAVVGSVEKMAAAFPVLSTAFDSILPAMSGAWRFFLDSLWDSAKATLNAVVGLFVAAGSAIGAALAAISTGNFSAILSDVGDAVRNAFGKDYVAEFGQAVADQAARINALNAEITAEQARLNWETEAHKELLAAINAEMAAGLKETTQLTTEQIDAIANKTLDLKKDLAGLNAQMASLRAGRDPGQHARLVDLETELKLSKKLSAASAEQKAEWLKQAAAIDVLTASVQGMKEGLDLERTTAELKLENDALTKNAGAVLYLAEAKAKLANATSNADAATKAYIQTAAAAADAEQKRHDVIAGTADLLEKARAINNDLIFDDQERAYAQLEIEKEKWHRVIDLAEAGSEEQKRIQAAYNEWLKASNEQIAGKPWRDTVKKMEGVFHDGFISMIEGGKGSWKSFTTALRNTFKSEVADQIYKMFLQPFVVKVVASFLGGTGVAGAQSTGTLGGAIAKTGASVAGGGGFPIVPGSSTLAQAGGGFGGAFMGAAGGAYLGYQQGGTRGAVIGGVAGYAGGAALTAGSTALAAGWGAGASGGAALAGASSALAAIPVWGWAALAALAVFGSGKKAPSNKSAWGVIDLTSGSTSKFGNMTGDKRSQETIDARDSLFKVLAAFSQGITAATGGKLSGSTSVDVGQRDGIQVSGVGAGKYNTLEAATKAIFASMLQNLQGVDMQFQSVFKKLDFSNLEGALRDLEQAGAIINKEYVQKAPINDAAQAIKNLNDQFKVIIDSAIRLGISTTPIVHELNTQLWKLKFDFTNSIQDAITGITDPMALELQYQQKLGIDRIDSARHLGADLVLVEQLNALERQQIVDKYAQQTNAAIANQGRSILDFVKELTGSAASPLATQTALANAKKNFDDTLAMAWGGDGQAQQDITSKAQDYLDLQKAFSASSGDFFVVFDSVVAKLTMLGNGLNLNGGVTGSTSSTSSTATGSADQAAQTTATAMTQSVDHLQNIGAELVRQTAEMRATREEMAALRVAVTKQQASLDRIAYRSVA